MRLLAQLRRRPVQDGAIVTGFRFSVTAADEITPPGRLPAKSEPSWNDPGWRQRALCTISEGFCPWLHGELVRDAGGVGFTGWHMPVVTSFDSGGWCPRCRIWWRLKEEDDGTHVVANYPLPVPPIPPYMAETKLAVP